MTPFVPKSSALRSSPLFAELSELLLSALDFLGAAAGWIGLQDAGGGLTFPVRAGVPLLPPQLWGGEGGTLPWQQGYGSIWGFTIDGEPALLNDLKSEAALDEPTLRNLLSCPLIHDQQILGHVALANKAKGFTADDARVLQGLAHHIVRLLGRRAPAAAPFELSAVWRRILDRAAEGILLLNESGVLIHANTAWLNWTGFRAEELLGQTAPFPFWVSQRDLVQALSAAPAHSLPFCRRDQSLFWCRLETAEEQWGGQLVTVAFLRQLELGGGVAVGHEHPHLRFAEPDWLPLLLDLDNGIEGWEVRWEERTGLSARDMEGSPSVLVLDWLFPQQGDRDRVFNCFHHPRSPGCQLVLEVAAPHGSQRTLCTFLPLPSRSMAGMPRRWLLLLGDAEQVSQPNNHDGTTHKRAGSVSDG